MTMPYFAWDIVMSGGDNTVELTIDGTTEVRTLVTGTYRMSGDGGSSDFLRRLELAFEAHSEGGSWVFTLLDTGHLKMEYSRSVAVSINMSNSDLDCNLIGLASTGTFSLSGSPAEGITDFTVGHAWFPNTLPVMDGIERSRPIGSRFTGAAAQRSTTVTNVVKVFDAEFSDVVAPRIWEWFKDDSGWMTACGLTLADPNVALWVMWQWLLIDEAVYYYTAAGDECGPYYMIGESVQIEDYVTVSDELYAMHEVAIPFGRDA